MTEQHNPEQPAEPNADYWRGMDGALSEEIIRERDGKANELALQQKTLLWDNPNDTRWVHRGPRFARVLHVFHQESAL